MRELSPSGEKTIAELAEKHGFSRDAVISMLESVANGSGTMAQFDHPAFGGSGQWMSGGMTMVSDMFNDVLKARIQQLCSDLAPLAAHDPMSAASGTAQTQSQSNGHGSRNKGGLSSLFAVSSTPNWWPEHLGPPTSVGAQEDIRYAYFALARRLAIEKSGHLTLYDTLDHDIGGFSQQQFSEGSLSFNSQHGLVNLAQLPVVGASRTGADTRAGIGTTARAEVLATIEKLGELRTKGHLSEQEFAKKKTELLSKL